MVTFLHVKAVGVRNMQLINGLIFLVALQLSSTAFGQAYSLSTTSTELKSYGGIRA